MSQTRLYAYMTAGSAMGLVASFWQLLEKLALLKNQDVALSCNLNSVFSCSNVLNSHQASVFGPPNALIGVVMFTFFLAAALIGLTGSAIGRRLLLVIEALALFMLGFTLWFLYQSIFSIQSVCIFCIFVGTGVLFINAAMFRLSLPVMPLTAELKRKLSGSVVAGADIFVWLLVWLLVAAAMVIKFAG